jgi:hypothetical protein
MIMQQLKAAQNRVQQLQQQISTQNNPEQTKPQELQQQNNQQTPGNFEALNHAAAMNIYNHKELSTTQQQGALEHLQPKDNKEKKPHLVSQLEKAKGDVQTQEKLLGDVQSTPDNNNPELAKLKENPIFAKLPNDLKARPDVAQLVNNVEEEALLDPDKAVQALVDQALMGNKKAYMKLNEYSKNPYEKLQENAGKGMEKVISGAEGRPKVLEMIAGTPTEKANDAAAKLMNLSDRNPRAKQGFESLLRKGAINFTKVANQAKNLDPGHAAKSINQLMINGNLSKADRKGAVGILGQIAKESATGAAGQDAARGLTRAVKSDSLDIAKNAAIELKEATLHGNSDALTGLKKLSKCDDPSRASLALTQLGEVAMSGTSSSVEALSTIKKVAQDPGTNGKVRAKAVDTLGKVAGQGGANGKEAVDTISNIAVNKSNPANGHAFNLIGKMNDSTLNIKPNTGVQNPKDKSNLSDTETYQKVMATQQQMNTMSQQPTGFLNKFALQLMPAV